MRVPALALCVGIHTARALPASSARQSGPCSVLFDSLMESLETPLIGR